MAATITPVTDRLLGALRAIWDRLARPRSIGRGTVRVARVLRPFALGVLELAGLGLVSYAGFLVFRPLGFALAGASLVLAANVWAAPRRRS